ELDPEEIDAHGNVARRLEHEAERVRVRFLRLEVGVATGDGRELVVAVGRLARRGIRAADRVARAVRGDAVRLRRVEGGERRRAEAGAGGAAHEYLLVRLPAHRELRVRGGADGLVIVVAHAEVGLEGAQERRIDLRV